jgi:hypothetical protein
MKNSPIRMMMAEIRRCQARDWEPTDRKSMALLRMPSTTIFSIFWQLTFPQSRSECCGTSISIYVSPSSSPTQTYQLRNETAECKHTVHTDLLLENIQEETKPGPGLDAGTFCHTVGNEARRQVHRKTGRVWWCFGVQ